MTVAGVMTVRDFKIYLFKNSHDYNYDFSIIFLEYKLNHHHGHRSFSDNAVVQIILSKICCDLRGIAVCAYNSNEYDGNTLFEFFF